MIVFYALCAVIATTLLIGGMFIAKSYNTLVALKNQTENGFNQISVQLQRRYDLIPNLVECCRSYLSHERETLEAVIAARNDAAGKLQNASKNPTDSGAVNSLAGADGALNGALGKLSFVMEAYPDLKANESVAALTEELTSTENRVAFARQAYNDWATAFNVMRQSFPAVMYAESLGFKDDFSMLEFEEAKAIKQAPQVSLV